MKIPVEEKIQILSKKRITNINARLDNLIFHSVDSDTFENDILPTETNDSVNVYFVHSQTEIQLWKGNIRIPLSGEGETWTVGVININSITS